MHQKTTNGQNTTSKAKHPTWQNAQRLWGHAALLQIARTRLWPGLPKRGIHANQEKQSRRWAVCLEARKDIKQNVWKNKKNWIWLKCWGCSLMMIGDWKLFPFFNIRCSFTVQNRGFGPLEPPFASPGVQSQERLIGRNGRKKRYQGADELRVHPAVPRGIQFKEDFEKREC